MMLLCRIIECAAPPRFGSTLCQCVFTPHQISHAIVGLQATMAG